MPILASKNRKVERLLGLRAIKRRVGMVQKILALHRIVRIHGDANAA